MNAIIIASILFLGNLLPIYNICETCITCLSDYWLGLTLFLNLCRILCTFKKELVYKGTLYLVNRNISFWTESCPYYMLLPWYFIISLLINYTANGDREYMVVIDKWDDIVYNKYYILYIFPILYTLLVEGDYYTLFISLVVISEVINCLINCNNNIRNIIYNIYINTILYLLFSINYLNYGIYFILLHQIISTIIYLYKYSIECTSKLSLNMDSIDFKCGRLYLNRPLMYMNFLWIIVPAYILFVDKSWDKDYFS